MAQHDYNIANQGFSSFRSDLNNALSAVQTTNSGTSRPTGAVAGQLWLDTTTATSPTLKYYDGADDISLATIDHTANTVNWLDSTVSITGLSTTATGTVLTLSDSATTSTVNLIIDNDKEIRFREATANGTNYVSLSAPASLSADLTFTLPATDGTVGQVLQTNGSGVLSFATVGGLAWQSIVTASTLTAVANRGYWINTTSNACTVTLPASATNGDTIILADYASTWGTNAVTINQNSLNFQGSSSVNPIYDTNRQSVTIVYSGATKGWIPIVDDDVTDEVAPRYSVNFLVVAGGGGSGNGTATPNYATGGGGAGGFRTSTQTAIVGTVITVTVGDGGGTDQVGSNSSISGSGLTTITSAGGGDGAAGEAATAGGSGGGGGAGITAGNGNTPSTSPSQGNNGGAGSTANITAGGGGGGANAVGTAGTAPSTSTGGNGGNGTASSITGSSVTYAGGGGGGSGWSGNAGDIGGTGGTGGGGNGAVNSTGTNGTANLGGGGGGGRGGVGGGASGGKGVVILSVPTASYSSTSTGSPTITTSGSNTILKFTGSGSYTA
jgi:hypothetical protein